MHLAEMQSLEKLHVEFHLLVGKIIDAKKVDDLNLANQLKTQLGKMSKEVIALIDTTTNLIDKENQQPH